MTETPWIGLVHVTGPPEHEILDGGAGAYVNVLALADSTTKFEALVRKEVARLRLEVSEIEDAEPLTERLKAYDVDDILVRLAAQLSEEDPVAIDVFNIYEEDD